MIQIDRKQFFYPVSVPQSILLILVLLVCLGSGACSPAKNQSGNNGLATGCGECLDMPTGEVCTPAGTRRNSCLAICEGIKINCFQSCPCPAE